MQTTLTRILIVLESVSDGLSENADEISRKARKFEGFFRPKSGGLQKKKKKKKRSSPKLSLIFRPKSEIQRFFPPKIRWSPKKKRSSPKLSLIFWPNAEIQTFQGGCFLMGGAIFNFSQNIGLMSIKNVRFCILHKPMGGSSPPPPPLATLLGSTYFKQIFKVKQKKRFLGEIWTNFVQISNKEQKRSSAKRGVNLVHCGCNRKLNFC